MTEAPATEAVAPKPRATISVRVFLRARPYPFSTGPSLEAERGFLLSGKDTTGALYGEFVGNWLGAEALKFVKEHDAELIPGRCVDLQVTNVRPDDKQLRAVVVACQMAPEAPSWIKHREKQTATTTESNA